MTRDQWSGHRVKEARDHWFTQLPLPCHECGEPVYPAQGWVVAHILPRWKYPELALHRSNQTVSHKSCSDKTARAEQQASIAAHDAALPSWQRRARDARAARKAAVSGATPGQRAAVPAQNPPLYVNVEREATTWPDVLEGAPWLFEFVRVPDDATAPRYMTAPHPDAVGSYGAEFLAWADGQPGLHPKRTEGLRWFQRLLAVRLLEHDAGGRLVWRNVLLTLSRQCGKSWFVRALICWRIQQRARFGEEEQTVIHVAHKLIAAQEVWRPAKRWGLEAGWTMRAANGEQMLEDPATGGRWLVRAASDGVGVGFSLSMLVGDEAWKLNREVIESADAALTESESPQLVLISTAGDSGSDLFGVYRAEALEVLEAPANTLLVEWSTPRGLPTDAPSSWRLASPFWSQRREAEVADKFRKLEDGEFQQNFLNWWLPVRGRAERALPAFDAEELAACNGTGPVTPVAAGVEDWFGQGFAVAFADVNPAGEARVTVGLYSTAAEASEAVRSDSGALQAVVVGKTLLADPEFAGFRLTGAMMNSRHTVSELRRLLKDGGLRHDGSPAFLEQALAVRVVDGPNGPSVKSDDPMGAIKAVVWAAQAARALPPAAQIF